MPMRAQPQLRGGAVSWGLLPFDGVDSDAATEPAPGPPDDVELVAEGELKPVRAARRDSDRDARRAVDPGDRVDRVDRQRFAWHRDGGMGVEVGSELRRIATNVVAHYARH